MDVDKFNQLSMAGREGKISQFGQILAMEGTTSQETRPRSFQINTLSDDLDDISLLLDKGCY